MIVEEDMEVSLESNTGWDPRIKVAKCGDLVRAYIIRTERFVLVYDTLLGPQSGAWLRQQALMFGSDNPILVVNSHADWDHYFGNMAFTDTIIGNTLCAKRIQGGVGAMELAKKRTEHPESYKAVSLVAPSVQIPGDFRLDGSDLTLEFLHTPGHRPDHISLWIPEIKTLFPGDCVETPIPLVDDQSKVYDETVQELVDSLESFLKLKPKWVLANHAAPEDGTQRIQQNLDYLKKLQSSARKAQSLEELTEACPEDSEWPEFYRNAHQNQVRMAWEQRQEV